MKKILSYEATKNMGYNALKKLAISYNSEYDMTCLISTICKDNIIKTCLKLQACKIFKTKDTVYFVVIHATNVLNKIATYKLFGNNRNYNLIYKNLPIVNLLTNRIKTLSHGMSYNHALVINENLRQHLINDKRKLNKKYYYAIGISNSMIDYNKFTNIIGHKYYNKDDIKTNIKKYQ